jgi:hypothetical protein
MRKKLHIVTSFYLTHFLLTSQLIVCMPKTMNEFFWDGFSGWDCGKAKKLPSNISRGSKYKRDKIFQILTKKSNMTLLIYQLVQQKKKFDNDILWWWVLYLCIKIWFALPIPPLVNRDLGSISSTFYVLLLRS